MSGFRGVYLTPCCTSLQDKKGCGGFLLHIGGCVIRYIPRVVRHGVLPINSKTSARMRPGTGTSAPCPRYSPTSSPRRRCRRTWCPLTARSTCSCRLPSRRVHRRSDPFTHTLQLRNVRGVGIFCDCQTIPPPRIMSLKEDSKGFIRARQRRPQVGGRDRPRPHNPHRAGPGQGPQLRQQLDLALVDSALRHHGRHTRRLQLRSLRDPARRRPRDPETALFIDSGLSSSGTIEEP